MSNLKIDIKSFGGRILFSYETENNTIKKTLENAVLRGADLTDAVLRGAVLRGAVLRGAFLRDAVLTGAVLTDADLRGAVLRGADLRGADLRGADLRSAFLRDAVLTGAVLTDAVLTDAVLTDADLRGADLRSADLRSADLRNADLRGFTEEKIPKSFLNQCTRDMLFVFQSLKPELPYLRKALIRGKINGTQYEGTCSCLIGTLAKADGGLDKVCAMIPYYDKGIHNFGEQWFWNIREGDTPKNSFFAKHAVYLIDLVLKASK